MIERGRVVLFTSKSTLYPSTYCVIKTLGTPGKKYIGGMSLCHVVLWSPPRKGGLRQHAMVPSLPVYWRNHWNASYLLWYVLDYFSEVERRKTEAGLRKTVSWASL